MTARAPAEDTLVELPVMALYCACHLARRQSRFDDAGALEFELAMLPRTGRAKKLAAMVESAMPDAIIPLHRDALDVHVACVSLPAKNQEAFRLFSEDAAVDLGYILAQHLDVDYVDRLPIANRGVPDAPELLRKDRVDRLIDIAQGLDDRPVAVTVPVDSDFLLEIESAAIEACCGSPGTFDAEIILLRADPLASIGAIRRRLVSAKVKRGSSGMYGLHVRPEHAMEIHAAAMAGHWLLVESRELRLLTPLPDFTEEGARVEGWLHPTQLFIDALGVPRAPSKAIDRELAAALVWRHRWCGAVDALHWFSAVQSQTLHPGSSSTP